MRQPPSRDLLQTRTHARHCSGALTRASARYVFTFSSNFGRLPFFIKAFYSPCAAAVALDNIYISGQGAVPVLSMSRDRCMPLAGGTPDLVYLRACNAGDCSRGRWLLEHHYRCDVGDVGDVLKEKTNKCDVNWAAVWKLLICLSALSSRFVDGSTQ